MRDFVYTKAAANGKLESIGQLIDFDLLGYMLYHQDDNTTFTKELVHHLLSAVDQYIDYNPVIYWKFLK